MQFPTKSVLSGAFTILLGILPVWAQQSATDADDSDSPADISHGAPQVDEALSMGILDEVVAPEELMDVATRAAQRLARIPADTYQLTKEALIGQS